MGEEWLNKFPHLFVRRTFICCLKMDIKQSVNSVPSHSGMGTHMSKQDTLDMLLSENQNTKLYRAHTLMLVISRHFICLFPVHMEARVSSQFLQVPVSPFREREKQLLTSRS